jgi:hypothetical protein
MKILTTTLLMLSISIAVLMNTTVYAAEEHEPSNASNSKSQTENAGMMKMHENMSAMQAQMQAIHAEKDPVKRKELMQAHRKSMHEGMQMMMQDMGGNGMMGGMMHGGKQKAMMGNRKMDEHARMDHMEERMNMMQQMMDQMMQHEDAMNYRSKK